MPIISKNLDTQPYTTKTNCEQINHTSSKLTNINICEILDMILGFIECVQVFGNYFGVCWGVTFCGVGVGVRYFGNLMGSGAAGFVNSLVW